MALAGEVVCVSGAFQGHQQADIEARLRVLGAQVAKSVTQKCTLLLLGSAAAAKGKKYTTAQSRGLRIETGEVWIVAQEEGGDAKPVQEQEQEQEEVEEEDNQEEEQEQKPVKEASSSSSSSAAAVATTPSVGGSVAAVAVPKVKAWKNEAAGEPSFPAQYEVLQHVILQCSRLKTNNNKFYGLELHHGKAAGGRDRYRLYTHYGRSDDLMTHGRVAGQRETRYYDSLAVTCAAYDKIYREKTRASKGYVPVGLSSSVVGSDAVAGKATPSVRSAASAGGSSVSSAGSENSKRSRSAAGASASKKRKGKGKGTLEGIDEEEGEGDEEDEDGVCGSSQPRKKARKGRAANHKAAEEDDEDAEDEEETNEEELDPAVADLVRFLYNESTSTLTSAAAVQVTADGLMTPLGVLSVEQVEIGQRILEEINDVVNENMPQRTKNDRLVDLSGQFYSAVPHRLGRGRQEILAACIRTPETVQSKMELLQLMRDMLGVNSDNRVLFEDDVVRKYRAMGCTLSLLEPHSKEFAAVITQIRESVRASHGNQSRVIVQRIFTVHRPVEEPRYRGAEVGNERLLYHGSRMANWVGILSRGLLQPKAVVKLGVHRTDGGWLGSGLYFGNSDTSAGYAQASQRRRVKYMLGVRVALGNQAEYRKITYGLSKPPSGFDSCRGVAGSQFYDDEFVVYDNTQVRITYLIELAP